MGSTSTPTSSHQSKASLASYSSTAEMKSPRRPALLVLLFVVEESFEMGGDQAYCRFSPQHTLCRYQGVGAQCSRVGDRGLTVGEQNEVQSKLLRFREKGSLNCKC